MPCPAEPAQALLPPLAATEKYSVESVIWLKHWTPALFSLRITRGDIFHFVPGQFARLGLRRADGEFVWRAYSVCSAPDTGYLEFYLVTVPGGKFTDEVANYDIGAPILLERHPQGFLTADRLCRGAGGKELWMLATGTGLGPFLSMLRDAQTWREFDHLILVHSVRHAGEFAYAGEISAWQNVAPFADAKAQLHYVRTATREHAHGCLHGRIAALIENGTLAEAAGVAFDPGRSRFMLCGNPEMVEQTRKLLKARGYRNDRRLEPGHIVVENYW
jgi:ferredoxin--NADP+ reductase